MDALMFTRKDKRTILAALGDAAAHQRERSALCADCGTGPAERCPGCRWRLELAVEYERLAARMREPD